jgi:hypothetical protein
MTKEQITPVKDYISRCFLGEGNVHGVGMGDVDGALGIRIYYKPIKGTSLGGLEQQDVLMEISNVANEIPVEFIESEPAHFVGE